MHLIDLYRKKIKSVFIEPMDLTNLIDINNIIELIYSDVVNK